MNSAAQTTAIVAYMPVLHQGYVKFLERADAGKMYVIGQEFLEQLPQLRKDVRALKPEQIQEVLQTLLPKVKVDVLTVESAAKLNNSDAKILMPDEDISHLVAEKYLAAANVKFDSVFLRWDSQKSLAPVEVTADQTIKAEDLAHTFLKQAGELAQKSSDWWRQVGGVLVKDGQVILHTHNQHVPTELEPYYNGDPRGNFHKGEHIDLSTALHAEAGLIAHAAERGISLKGTQLYVTTFPCPNCAKLVAYSGIKEVYFQDGYAMVDGESIMKARGVKIVKVEA